MSQLAQAPETGHRLSRNVDYQAFGSKEIIKLSLEIVKSIICVPGKQGEVCDDRQAMKFMMMCKARGLNPFEGDAFLIPFTDTDSNTTSFTLITAHQAFLKRAEVHPEYDGMESGVVLKNVDGKFEEREGDMFLDGEFLLGGWAVVHFKTRSHPMRKRLSLAVFSTGKARWKKDPAGMIVKCAEADALRSSFPTQLGGLYIDGELMLPQTLEEVPLRKPPLGRSHIRNGKPLAITAPVVQGIAGEDNHQGDERPDQDGADQGQQSADDEEMRAPISDETKKAVLEQGTRLRLTTSVWLEHIKAIGKKTLESCTEGEALMLLKRFEGMQPAGAK